MIRRVSMYKQGAVKLKLSGEYPERFINCCINDHIYLWGVKKVSGDIYAWIALADFFRLRPAARKSRTRIHVVNRYGFPFVFQRIKQRKILLAGVFGFFAALYWLSGYVFFVEVQGAKLPGLSQAIEQAVTNHGVYVGARSDDISCKNIEKAILNEFPNIAWAGVHFTGTRVVVEVVEKVVPPEREVLTGNLVAAKSGVVKECIAIQGERVINKGDQVKEGDLLIRAVVGKDGIAQADGLVKANVEYEGQGEASLVEAIYRRSGRFDVSASVRVSPYDTELVLRNADLAGFLAYEEQAMVKKVPGWRNSNFAVELRIDVYHELNVDFLERSIDEAKVIASQQAMCDTQKLIPEDAAVIERTFEVLPAADANLVKVRLRLITEEEISKHIKYSKE